MRRVLKQVPPNNLRSMHATVRRGAVSLPAQTTALVVWNSPPRNKLDALRSPGSREQSEQS